MTWGFELIEVSRRPALRGLSLHAPAGSVTALAGPPAVTSTAFRLLAGLDRPDEGAALAGGVDLARAGGRTARRAQRRMAVVFGPGEDRGYALFDRATVAENVDYAVRQAGRASRRRAGDVVRRELARFGLEEVAGLTPSLLPPTTRKLVALARALALGSPLLLVDDLPADLDAADLAAVGGVLRHHARERMGACLVTGPDAARLEAVADRVVEAQAAHALAV